DRLRAAAETLAAENEKDLAAAPGYGLSEAAVDRLRLTPERIEGMAVGLEEVAALPDPVGQVIGGRVRPNGLAITKIREPLGVIFFIYESRPNVTADAAALCVKSGNAVILRGGKEALHSNRAISAVLGGAAVEFGLPAEAVQVVPSTDRELVGEFLGLGDLIDLTIPRGGKSLIERVATEARMPVLKHYDGICHVYVDGDADVAMAIEIASNSKAQRPGVCNAAETLLVDTKIAAEFLPKAGEHFDGIGVELRGCPRTLELVPTAKPATDEDYATEHLALILSVKVVDGVEAAVEHVNRFGSGHTESIVTRDIGTSQRFVAGCDSAAVMVNASTRFNDGHEFGLGAEIGISTDKFHARGPCGLEELTTTKYVVRGDGQVRG
ncbi:MAG: glutamate-5-semialdehyde dehydrogenase, partial [Planctomycetota bacterium]